MMIGHEFDSTHTLDPTVGRCFCDLLLFKENLNATTAEQSKKFFSCLKKRKLDASRPSGHPPIREENVKTFRWDHRLQRLNR